MKLKNFLIQLGQPVAYYPKLAKFLGSVKAAVFICQLGYWEGKQRDDDGIYKTMVEFQVETGLSRREQDTARKTLRDLGYLFETKKGMPARIYYCINWDKINDDWALWIRHEQTQEKKKTKHKTAKLASTNSPNKSEPNRQTDDVEIHSKIKTKIQSNSPPENTSKITQKITDKVRNFIFSYPQNQNSKTNRGFETLGDIFKR